MTRHGAISAFVGVIALGSMLSACAGMNSPAMVSDATSATPSMSGTMKDEMKDPMTADGTSRPVKLYWFLGGR